MTAQELINHALKDLGVLAAGESPSTEESSDALERLNDLLASWSAQALAVYEIKREQFVLTGSASYAIGSGQLWNTSRPVKIEAAAVTTVTGLRFPVEIATPEKWAAYTDTTATGLVAQLLWYDNGYPMATISLAPRPAGGWLELYSYKELTAIASLNATVDLPPGYKRALITNLALELAPMFGREASPTLAANAADAKMSIFGLNRAVEGSPTPVEPPPPAPPQPA